MHPAPPPANPSVFEYGVAQLDGKHVYLHVFHGRFLVYALELSKEMAAARLSKKISSHHKFP